MNRHQRRAAEAKTKNCAEHLQSLQPCLITHVDLGARTPDGGMEAEIESYIRQTAPPHKVLSEGYENSWPLYRPVYWRFVERDGRTWRLSTFLMSRDEVMKGVGNGGSRVLRS